MSTPLLTVVLPIRNRSGVRLENCLRGLRWQEGLSPDNVEILISDFGSAPEHRDAVVALASAYNARVQYTPADGLWNRSRALNIGVKRAQGRFTLCTDVDMVMAPTFLRVLMDTQDELGGRGMLLCQSRDLGPETEGKAIELADYDSFLRSTSMRPTHGMGGCQCAETNWFHSVRGYDEGYTYWGAEDTDMVRRAERDGRIIQWVTDKTAMIHQWHQTTKYDKPWLVRKNKWRLTLTGWIVRKNRRGWGE
jgi:glycosyltransferase involved in cell wall biosynthesis